MKRLIINEDERQEILNQHKKAINEQIAAPADSTYVYNPSKSWLNGYQSNPQPTFWDRFKNTVSTATQTANKAAQTVNNTVKQKTPTKTKTTQGYSYYIKQAQSLLGVPQTGVVDEKTLEAAKSKLGGGSVSAPPVPSTPEQKTSNSSVD